MPRIIKMSLLSAIFAGVYGLAMSSPADAQTYVCSSGPGPGEVSAGWLPGGNGIAPIPLCAEQYDPDAGAPSRGKSSYDQDKHMQDLADAARLMAEGMQRTTEQNAQLEADPAFQKFLKGEWRFFQARQTAKPGENCTALWMKQGGLFSIAGPGPGYQGGLLTFWSPDIPKVKKAKIVAASIKQSDGSIQTVKAINYVVPGIDLGAITLSVPSIEAGINDMVDKDHIELLLKGKVVANVDWTGGLMARNKLRECVARHR